MASKRLQLNSEQQAVVAAGQGVWAIGSGPGSGKSTSLVARYLRLVDEGCSPNDILSLTFTSEAARSMRAKATAAGAPEKDGSRVAGFLTFHSVALSFATQERENFPFDVAAFPLATEAQTGRAIGETAQRFSLDPKTLRSFVSLQKRTQVSPARAVRKAEQCGEGEKDALAYKAYEEKLRGLGVLDFDGLMVEMAALLEARSDVRARWQYRFIMVDECQDCDSLQYHLLRLMSEQHGNLFLVGDGAQGVYGFRGADPEVFLKIEDHFPGAQKLYLARNHRSTAALVDFLKQVGPVRDLAEKFHTTNPLGIAPEVLRFPSGFDEATEVARRIKQKEVHNPDSVAILCRTNRGLRPFEDSLSTAGVRYRLLGKSGFYQQPEVRSILSFLQCVISPFDNAVLGAIRSPFEPSKFLRKKEICDALQSQQKADPTKPSIFNLLNRYVPNDLAQTRTVTAFRGFLHSLTKHRNLPPAAAVEAVVQATHAHDYYADGDNASGDNNPTDNLAELSRAAARFNSIPAFLDHVRKVLGASKSKKGVVLASCHAAKGQEWSDVFVVNCTEGMMPHKNADNLGEEERVFFVAVSRAAEKLVITFCGHPSRFIPALMLPPDPAAAPDDFFDALFAEVQLV